MTNASATGPSAQNSFSRGLRPDPCSGLTAGRRSAHLGPTPHPVRRLAPCDQEMIGRHLAVPGTMTSGRDRCSARPRRGGSPQKGRRRVPLGQCLLLGKADMMSIRSLADFNGNTPGGAVTGFDTSRRHRPGSRSGPTRRAKDGAFTWLSPRTSTWPHPGLSHGHGQRSLRRTCERPPRDPGEVAGAGSAADDVATRLPARSDGPVVKSASGQVGKCVGNNPISA